jgi:CBS domain-containing protein
MKVRELMTREAASCGLDASLATAVHLMEKRHLGFLPVTGDGGNVIGAITDRDICVALGTRNQKASEVLVRDVVLAKDLTSAKLYTCTADDKIHCVLKTMREAKIRRLPVVNAEGELQGILSIDDLVLRACEHAGKEGISCAEVVETYQAISRPMVEHPVAA